VTAATPPGARAWVGRGLQGLRLGRTQDAIACFRSACRLDPDNDEFLRLLVESYRRHAERLRLTGPGEARIGALPRNRPLVDRMHPLTPEFFAAMPGVAEAIEAAGSADRRRREAVLELPGFRRLAAYRPFLAYIEEHLLTLLGLELLLTAARRALLLSGRWRDEEAVAGTEFLCALAQQCFTNEYVFDETAEETALVDRLRQEIEAEATAGRASPRMLAVFAAYRPLLALDCHHRLRPASGGEAFADLMRRQVEEPLAERAIAAQIDSLTPVAGVTSELVRRVYEENPYPRWHLARRPPPSDLRTTLTGLFPGLGGRPLRWPERPAGLIAGCGTGRQSAALGQLFPGTRFTAIDLSRPSLAHAVRRHAELGIANVEFYQADILALDAVERQFDVIFCGGVLHHLEEPEAGWRALAARLRPGGFMRVSVYSRAGRREVNLLREFVRAGGFGATADEIRRCRRAILALPGTHPVPQVCCRFADFFSTSMFRDLAMHPVEHQTTFAELGELLRRQGLEFVGIPRQRLRHELRHLAEHVPAEGALDYWRDCERRHPDLILSLYELWVRRPD
jgi:SAM-dependent methyltransferase